MDPQQLRQLTDHAAELFDAARQPVALTGAGISTPSGIPDFRSSGSGLWNRVDPMEVASLQAFRRDPQRFYHWFQPLAGSFLSAEPNPAHLALAELEQAGRLAGIVTQNIDGLHQRAGSRKVTEVHGNLKHATCISCLTQYPADPLLRSYAETGEAPRCPRCGGALKPDVILIGEQLPHEQIAEARALFKAADLVLVLGSSLEVVPVCKLPYYALEDGARLVIINLESTYLDQRADVLIHADVAEVMPALAAKVMHAQ